MKKTKMRRTDTRRWNLGSRRLFLFLIISESSEGFISPWSSFAIRPHNNNNNNHKVVFCDNKRNDFKRQYHYYALTYWNHRVVAKAAASVVVVVEDIDHDKMGNVSSSSSSSSSAWEAGDVYKDLEVLERAIAHSNAPQNLERHLRLEMLNQFAQERKVLASDVYRYICKPFHACLALTTLLQLLIVTTTTTTTSFRSWWTYATRLFGVLDQVSMAHFRLVVLLAPLLLWLSIQRQRQIHAKSNNNNNDLPPELRGIDPDYYRFIVTDWQDPRTSCQDHVLCLVEQWISVILGTVLVEVLMHAPFIIGAAAATRTVTTTSTSATTVARLLQQLITRLAVVASLHQYPKLWFQLNRTLQPRPVTWSTFALQTAISMLATPWFMTWNFSRLLVVAITLLPSSYSGSTLLPIGLYSLFVTLFLAIKFLPPPPPTTTILQHAKPKWVTRNLPLLKRGAFLSTILIFLHCCWNPLLRAIRMAQTTTSREFLEWLSKVALPSFTSSSSSIWQLLATFSTTMLICGPPMCHLVAATRIFRIQYMHDLSLANANPTEFQQASQEDGRFQWRYRMNWREPQRIRTTLREWRRRLGYWFFFAGSVQEKLRRQDAVAQRRRLQGGGEVKRRGLTAVQRIKQDMGSAATLSLLTDRTKWKQQAMERLAKLHEQSYQHGSFYDPLGIAIHRAFDIGLGFNFDHFSNIEDGVTSGELSLSPSTRRLQARAAKSALKRAPEIYTASNAQRELDQIQDPVKRNAKAKELRQQADNEIKFIAGRLTELIPTDLNLGNNRREMENDDQLRPYELRDTFERKSANEYTLHRSQAIRNLSDLYASRSSSSSSTKKDAMYEIDYLNPSGKKPSGSGSRSSNDDNDIAPVQDTVDKDDEFIQEWLKNEQSRKDSTTTTSKDNDRDNDDRTVLA